MLTVYTTETCSYCKILKKYLSSKNVEFKEVDVTNDLSLREFLYEKTNMMSVPVTTNGTDYVVGFDTSLLQKMI